MSIFQVQLKVTPKAEGSLKIVGVRWKLSGSVVGLHKFQSDMPDKKSAKGRRKVRQSPLDNLCFLVIKVHAVSLYTQIDVSSNPFTDFVFLGEILCNKLLFVSCSRYYNHVSYCYFKLPEVTKA